MSDTTNTIITDEERDLWRFEASDECGTPREEDERILRLIDAFEACESDLERSCEETRANFSELYRMANEVVPELKKRAEQAEAEVARMNKILAAAQECVLNGDSCSMPEGGPEDCALLHDIADLFASNRCARIDSARLTKERDWLAEKCAMHCHDKDRDDILCSDDTCAIQTCWGASACDWKEAARKAVADAGSEV